MRRIALLFLIPACATTGSPAPEQPTTTPDSVSAGAPAREAPSEQVVPRIPIMKADPPVDCEDVGPLQVWRNTSTIDDIYSELRHEAVGKGGNYFRLDYVSERVMFGTAFKCPSTSSSVKATQ